MEESICSRDPRSDIRGFLILHDTRIFVSTSIYNYLYTRILTCHDWFNYIFFLSLKNRIIKKYQKNSKHNGEGSKC